MTEQLSNFDAELGSQVLERLVQGQPLPALVDELRKTHSAEKIDAALQYAYEFLAKESRPDIDIEKGKALIRLDLLFMKDMKIKDYKAALQVQVERNKMLGLHAKAPRRTPPKPVNPIADEIGNIIDIYENG